MVGFDGERVTLRSAAAFAPGAPITGALAEPAGMTLSVKVFSCRRDGDAFVIVGRMVNPTRELRALLLNEPAAGG